MDEERQNPHDTSDYDESEKLYEVYLKEEEELSKRDLSNVENLDKAILSAHQVPVWGYHWFS